MDKRVLQKAIFEVQRSKLASSGSANVRTITNNCHNLEAITRKFNVDPQRIFNFDETGMSTGKNAHGTCKKKAIVPSGMRCHTKGPDFDRNISRVSLLACVSAAGEAVCQFKNIQSANYWTHLLFRQLFVSKFNLH